MHAFKFNDVNTISVTCSVRYCPPEFTNQCQVITVMYLVEKGPLITSGGYKGAVVELHGIYKTMTLVVFVQMRLLSIKHVIVGVFFNPTLILSKYSEEKMQYQFYSSNDLSTSLHCFPLFSIHLLFCPSVRPSVCRYVRPYVCLYVCLSV